MLIVSFKRLVKCIRVIKESLNQIMNINSLFCLLTIFLQYINKTLKEVSLYWERNEKLSNIKERLVMKHTKTIALLSSAAILLGAAVTVAVILLQIRKMKVRKTPL